MSYRIFSKIFFIALIVCGLLAGCADKKSNGQVQPKKAVLSLDPADSVAFNELLAFYLEAGILTEDALVCDHADNGRLYPLCCLSEDVQCALCAPGYMQDSLHGTFYQEIDFDMGSSGDGSIYICEKDAKGFRVLCSVVGVIDLDAPVDEFVNGYRVIYFTTDGGENKRKLYYDGKNFVEEDIPDNILVNN